MSRKTPPTTSRTTPDGGVYASRRTHRRAGARAAAGVALASMLGLAGSAQAYAIKTNEAGHAVRWAEMPVTFVVSEAGARDLPRGPAVEAVRAAFAAWTTVPGADIRFDDEGLDTVRLGFDRVNSVLWSRGHWEDAGFAPDALAITVATFSNSTGHLLDADIIVNEAHHQWGIGQRADNDLQNAMTHEVGHFLGFGHSEDPEATMFASARPGETGKRTLHSDDHAAARRLYGNGEETPVTPVAPQVQQSAAFRDDAAAPPAPSVSDGEATMEAPSLGCVAAAPGRDGAAPGGLALLLLAGLGYCRLRRANR